MAARRAAGIVTGMSRPPGGGRGCHAYTILQTPRGWPYAVHGQQINFMPSQLPLVAILNRNSNIANRNSIILPVEIDRTPVLATLVFDVIITHGAHHIEVGAGAGMPL